jgi:ABC-type multidrug transport system ATPase subunit
MQEDQLLPHLTVEEAMMCSANLKLKESLGGTEKRKVVRSLDLYKDRNLNASRCDRGTTPQRGDDRQL